MFSLRRRETQGGPRFGALLHEASGAHAAALDGALVVAGGLTSTAVTATVERLRSGQHATGSLPSLPRPRAYAAAFTHRGTLYLVGGRSGADHACPTLALHAGRVALEELRPMRIVRRACGTAEVWGSLYVSGGHGPDGNISSLERYNVGLDEQTGLAPLPRARRALALAADGALYALDGFDGRRPPDGVERGVWEFRAPLPRARCSQAVAAVEERSWSFGGFEGGEVLDAVTMYDPKADRWSDAAVRLSVPAATSRLPRWAGWSISQAGSDAVRARAASPRRSTLRPARRR